MKTTNSLLFWGICIISQFLLAENVSVKAMNNYEKQYEVLMNNVVNANTPGYKGTRVITFSENGELQTEIAADSGRGPLVNSGDEFHLAIEGSGYFVVESPQGLLYTRDGRLKLNSEMQLVTLVGNYPLYGESGPIYLNTDASGVIHFSVSDGGLIVQKDNVVDRLLIGEITNYNSVDLIKGAFFKQRTIKKVKGTSGDRYSIDSDVFQPLENPKVRQGYYEASNIDVAKELVNMPMISKKYDANSKALQIIKRSRKSSLEMGRPQ